MIKKYVIFTDVSISIDPVYADKNNVHIIPMDYIIGDKVYKYDGNQDAEKLQEYYDGLRNGENVKTSQVSPQEYINIFEPLVKEGLDILYVALSSGLSGTYQSSLLAARELMDKYSGAKVLPVDSLCATGGLGLLVESAVENAKNEMEIEDNVKWINENKLKICHWFMVEDLEFLKRGGRISPATAVVGKTLNIKPILRLNDEGKIVGQYKKRGIKSVIKQFVKEYELGSKAEKNKRIYIIHSDAIENAKLLEKAMLEKNPDCNITKMILSPTLGAHTGPGMIGIFYYGVKR